MKFKSFLGAHSALVKDITISTCLVGATAGIVFGISAGTFHVNYMDLSSSAARLAAYNTPSSNYSGEKVYSAWNMNEAKTNDGIIRAADAPTTAVMTDEYWEHLHGSAARLYSHAANMKIDIAHPFGIALDPNDSSDAGAIKNRYDYTAMILDGSTHTNLDRSFNQSLYSGLIDFNRNYSVPRVDSDKETDPTKFFVANSYRPAQDNTTEFINIYLAAFAKHYVLGLAGFNHATPLNAIMTHKPASEKGYLQAVATHPNPSTNEMLNGRGMILIDSNVANNQCIASVQFRADQGAFLTALSTCMYFYKNLDMYHNKYQNLAIGILGGVQIPTVSIYLGGYERGVELFNAIILQNIIYDGGRVAFKIDGVHDDLYFKSCYNTLMSLIDHSRYADEIKPLLGDEANWKTYQQQYMQKLYDEFQVRLIRLGDISTHFTGSFNAGDAIGMTKQFLNRGAQAIVVVAGPQSVDAAQEIKNQNSNCIVIGVDTAMEDSDYQRIHEGCKPGEFNENDPWHDRSTGADGTRSAQANSIIKFSALKDIRNTTQSITQLIASGKHWDVTSPAWKHQYVPDYRFDPEIPTKMFVIDPKDETIITKEKVEVPEGEAPRWIINKFDSNKAFEKGFMTDKTETLVIPSAWVDPDGTVNYIAGIKPTAEMTAKGECAFNDLKNVRNLTFTYTGSGNVPEFILYKNAIRANNLKDPNPRTLLKCLDLGQLTNLSNLMLEDDCLVDFVRPPNDGGVLCLPARGIAAHTKDLFAEKLAGVGLRNWFFIGPDMEKSICSIGFQTCGNIQNGMVSISWDGFPLLIEALSHIYYNFEIGEPPITLTDAWKKSAKEYFDTLSDFARQAIPKEYYYEDPDTGKLSGEVIDLDNLRSYKRTEEDGTPTLLYSQYKTTIGILGSLLNRALVEFDGKTTLRYDEDTRQFVTMPDDKYEIISILQWLEWNMYLLG